MKSLAELQAIKEKMQNKVALREGSGELRVVVGMATCGIAAGARPVLNAFVEQVNEGGLAATPTGKKLFEQVFGVGGSPDASGCGSCRACRS